jgi:multiple sugar transport system substrate-binding protein
MIELKGMTWDHPRGIHPLLAVSEKFNEMHPHVRIHWDRRSLKDFGDYPIDRLAKAYDLIMFDHPHVGICSANRDLVALDNYLDEVFLSNQAMNSVGQSHESYRWNDKQWALAVDAAAQVSAYREDLIESNSLPANWDEVMDNAARYPRTVAWPLCPTDLMCSFITLCAQIGGHDWFNEDNGADLAVGTEALDRIRAILPLLHPMSLTSNPIQLLNHMSHTHEISYIPLTFGYSNYSRERFAPHRVRFGNVPSHSGKPVGSILGGVGMAVSAHSKQIPIAVQFATYTASSDIQAGFYVVNDGQPAHRSAWLNDRANLMTADFFKDTLATLDHSHVRPRHAAFPVFQEKAGQWLHEAIVSQTGSSNIIRHTNTLLER